MTLAYDPIPVLQTAGYTEREAAFLYLAALHSGYFLRRQYLRFIERGRGALAAQFLRRAFALGHIQSIACGQARFVYHLTSTEVYEAVGLGASHHRRLKSDTTIKSRLMVLDFVVDHLGATLLDTQESKVAHFTGTLGLSESLLPQSRGVVFAEEFPLLLNKDGGISFSYIDPGALSASGFEHFLERHLPLFHALPTFELIYLSDTTRDFDRASRVFTSNLPEEQAPGTTPLTPRGVNHLLDYLHVRELADSREASLNLRELAVLREGDSLYTSPEHQVFLAAGTLSAQRIRQQFEQLDQRRKFTALVLAYGYPLHRFKFESQTKPELGSRVRSIQHPVLRAQAMQQQPFSEGGDEE